MEQFEKRLELLDQRLDNIDSIIGNLVERVMNQPVTMEMTCPKCGSNIKITFNCSLKLSGKN